MAKTNHQLKCEILLNKKNKTIVFRFFHKKINSIENFIFNKTIILFFKIIFSIAPSIVQY